MRTGLKEGRVAGTGVQHAFVEREETYRDKKVRKVYFPSDFDKDHIKDERYSEITYSYMSPEEFERRYGTNQCLK
jgi:hypothetical protein